MAAHKYAHQIDLSLDNAHTRVIRLVGKGKRVLELGCATGYMSKVLAEQFECAVVGIELDPEAAGQASPACRRVIVGDLETLDYPRELGDERFDVIVCADVLEHLRDPAHVLDAVRPFLAPDGYVVASIPNIAHVSVIVELLEGRFPYRPEGLLDDTHIRFFTRDTIYGCFEQAGFVIAHLERVRVEPDATEFRTRLSRFPPEVQALLRSREEALTYQFVLRADPAPEGRGSEVLRRAVSAASAATAVPSAAPASEPADEPVWRARFDALLDALLARMAFIEEERRQQAGSLEELHAQVRGLTGERDHWRRHGEVTARERDDWRDQCASFAQQYRAVTEERDRWRGETERLQEELGRIQGGAGWALLLRYRRLRLALIPPGSRRETVYILALRGLRRLFGTRPAPGVGLRAGLAARAAHVRFLLRAARRIYTTHGARELAWQARVYLRNRPAWWEPYTLTPAQLQRWFVRHRRPVAIVIPTYKQTELVRQCVDSILGGLSPDAMRLVRIVLVDDGSGAEVQEYLRGLPAQVILRPQNEGFARAANAGIEATTGEDVVLLNNDTIARPGWLEALQFCAYRQRAVGILGPKLLYPDGRIQSAGSYRNTAEPMWFDHCYRFAPADYGPANVQREVLAVTGACMYIKREVLDRLGPLDPRFAMAFEDVDYCLRARAAGFEVGYCPHATLTHLEGHTRGERQEPRELRSQEYFWQTWGSHFDGRRVWAASPEALSIVYVVQDTGVAGGHRVIFEHVNRLRERGHDVRLYSLAGEPKWFALKAPVTTFKSYGALAADLAGRDAIKVATWWETSEPVWRASLTRGVPVYLVQDIETSYYHHEAEAHRERAHVLASYRKEFHYLTDATWTQKQLGAMGLSATVVHPGIDQALFKPLGLPRPANVLLSVGRSHPLKNIGLLLTAVEKLSPRPLLHLFGIEPDVGRGLAARYVFKPSDHEVAQLYNTATAFVLTSVHEGYGLPILEAMACGCPVVCTDADGNMDFCRDGENCLIVPRDDPDRLAKTLDRLLGDPALQDHLRRGGFATVGEYNWERAIVSLEEFYKAIARQRSRLA